MLTAREQVFYPLPDDLGRIVRLAVDLRETCGPWYAIMMIPSEEMQTLKAEKGEVLGMPTLAAVMLKDNQPHLVFHPTPDGPWNIDAVYEPHPKKF